MALTDALKVVDVLADVASVADKVIEEKGGTIAKLGHLMPLTGDAVTLAGVDFKAAEAEFAAASDADKAALMAEFAAKFSLDNAATAAKVVEGLALAVQAESLIAQIIAYGKSLRAAPAAVQA